MSEVQNTHVVSKLFTEKFRPQTLEQAILVPRVRQELSKGLQDHILLYGSAGIGKTTCTRILANLGTDPLFINASLERGIDVIRERIMSYATSSSLFGGQEQLKVVVLEECDNLTLDAWSALRATIEQYHSTVRFIANCNYIDKVPEPIQSRFNCICLEPINIEEEQYLLTEYIKRAGLILNALHISYTQDVLTDFIRKDFPDMRSITKKIQQMYTREVKELSANVIGNSFDGNELLQMILAPCNPIANYQALSGNWMNRADDAILIIGKQLPQYLMNCAPDKVNKLPLCVIAISEYNSQLSTSIDKFVTLLAMVYKLQMILNS